MMLLSLLRQPRGPFLALTTRPVHPAASSLPVRPLSTLSAINDALRKAHGHQAKSPSRARQASEDGKPMTYRERQNARQALAREKPSFKIRKGKKDITIDPSETKPLSRQKRFYDEENSFAKKSLVYQMKTGKLPEEAKKALEQIDGGRPRWTESRHDGGSRRRSTSKRGLEGKRGDRPEKAMTTDSFTREFENFGGRGAPRSDRRGGGRERERDRPARFESRSRDDRKPQPRGKEREGGRPARFVSRSRDDKQPQPRGWEREGDYPGRFESRSSEGAKPGSRPLFGIRESGEGIEADRNPARFGSESRGTGRPSRGRDDRDGGRPPRQAERSGARFEDKDRGSRFLRKDSPSSSSLSARPARRDQKPTEQGPLSIPYTTAASQFLYGKSVVEAAIHSSRRKLYKLYIYAGPGRQQVQEDMLLRNRAVKKGIQVEIVRDPSKARLLDQMSSGRPHNGYILEASPLPQLPVTGLGPYTDGTATIGGPTATEGTTITEGTTATEDTTTTEDAATTDGVTATEGTTATEDTITTDETPSANPSSNTDNGPKTPGYTLHLGHQSAEEAAINGKTPFVPFHPRHTALTPTSTTHKPLVVVLDQILDPGNLGAILRTVSFLGASAVAMTKRNSASLTPVALKASAGAAESLPLLSITTSLHEFLDRSREDGNWSVYAAMPESSTSSTKIGGKVNMYQIEERDPLRRGPCILVLGSEGEGLSGQVVSKADWQVSIPNLGGAGMEGGVDSLNVSVAAGLLTSAFMRGSIREMGSLEREIEKKAGKILW